MDFSKGLFATGFPKLTQHAFVSPADEFERERRQLMGRFANRNGADARISLPGERMRQGPVWGRIPTAPFRPTEAQVEKLIASSSSKDFYGQYYRPGKCTAGDGGRL